MTVAEALAIIQHLTPSMYGEDDLRRWLLMCERNIYSEIVRTHDGGLCAPEPSGEDCEELIVPDIMAEDVYINFLQARIAKENSENVKYNQSIALYNAAYERFARWYNERHRPRPRGMAWRF